MKQTIKGRRANGMGYVTSVEIQGRYSRPRTALNKGVTRQIARGQAFWVATLACAGLVRIQKFAVGRLGERAAKAAARAVRKRWLIAEGLVGGAA